MAMGKRRIVAGVGYGLRAASFEQTLEVRIGLPIARVSSGSETQQYAFFAKG